MDRRRSRRRRDSDDDSQDEDNNNDNDRLSKSDLNRQIEKLNRELQRREHELDDERQENARVLERVKKLERDKVELRREAEDFKDEANEYKKALEESKVKRKPGEEDLKDKYEVTIQQKNHEIQQLLDDLEKLEGEKSDLQDKLHELRDSLAEATSHLENMTQEHVNLKAKLGQSEAKVKEAQDEKVILEIKVNDLLNFKQRHDKYLENLCSAVDVRVDVWKKMMFQKDEEIDRLNVKLATLANQLSVDPSSEADKNVATQLKTKLADRESAINVLQEKLTQATQELESATEHINLLSGRLQQSGYVITDEESSMVDNLETQVSRFKYQINRKEQVNQQLEKEVEEKSKEITNLMARMHSYESGVYGLPEAIMEIKELKTQLRIRNTQIENMTQEINELNMKLNDIIDENDMLKSKIDVSQIDLKSETKHFTSQRTAEIQSLKSQVSKLQEELVTIKTKNYSIRKQLSSQTVQVNKTSTGKGPDDWKEKYELVLSENLELRKGLQEILEAMQRTTDEGTSDVLIESPVLESLLREMSARGLIHYPYGVSSFHLKVCNLEGKNSQLREEIHRLKQEEKQNRQDLIDAQVKIKTLQDKIVSLTSASASPELGGQPTSNDSMVDNLQAEVALLHGQIKHLRDVLQFESSIEKSEQFVQTDADLSTALGDGFKSQLNTPDGSPTDPLDKTAQTDITYDEVERIKQQKESIEQKLYQLETDYEALNSKLEDQKIMLEAKEKVINEIKLLSFNPIEDFKTVATGQTAELQEALNISKETVTSLQERLKSKEDNLNQYRQLLAELRNEMTSATNRHVQEMRALQLTIHQQQQAFTRMKSTLSHPVKDTLNIEGTIKDQLTRIHELEDEVSELQHTLGNVASQLTAARSEAHRWRCTAESRLKEMDISRDSQVHERSSEIQALKDKLKKKEAKISELEAETSRLKATKDSIQDLVTAIRNEHQLVQATSNQQKASAAVKELQDKLNSKEKELLEVQNANKELIQKVTGLQVRVSKLNSTNKTGITIEMEQLRAKYFSVEQEKLKLEEELKSMVRNRDFEDDKKRKAIESMVKWEEAKKWKKTVEKLELQTEALKKDNERLLHANKSLRANVTRLDKLIVDLKKLQPIVKSTGKISDVPAEVAEKLNVEIQDLNELLEKTEFEGKERIASLEIEIKCLKDRIVAQERQLAAYQVAQKGDPKVVSEIEKMAHKEIDLHKVINSLEEENLQLKLQIEQLRMDAPRLRDRLQQLQKLVEVLKAERTESSSIGTRSHSQRSLSELERTITALKHLIEKLQSENKRLKHRAPNTKTSGSASSETIKNTLENLMAEKRKLLNQLASMEDEKSKFQRMFAEANTTVETLQNRLQDSEQRMKSTEMKLKSFLGEETAKEQDNTNFHKRIKLLEEALDRKTQLLDEAKTALRQAANSSK